MMQNLSHETVTSRNEIDETALPIRTKEEMMAGTDLGGGGVHWAGASYRWDPYDFEIYSKTDDKYGKKKIPEDMTIQDRGITNNEMEKYYGKVEKNAGSTREEKTLRHERTDN